MTKEYILISDDIPKAFSGFRIVQVSDLHNAEFGEKNEKLLKRIREAEPDMIVITGDLIDSRHTNTDIALDFLTQAVALAPVYYVTGNHEARIYDAYLKMEVQMKKAGIHVLRGEAVSIDKDGQRIQLIGLDDPSFYAIKDPFESSKGPILQDLNTQNEEHIYTVLLAHRPELFDLYKNGGVDLVFCGHAHGGQFRMPFLGGLIAPGQGFFPKYDAGLYADGMTTMIVSRGIGNSIIPLRINNRPEVIVVELAKAA